MTIVEGVEDAERERPDALWSILSHKAAALGVAGCILLSHTPSHERCNLDQGEITSARSHSKWTGLRCEQRLSGSRCGLGETAAGEALARQTGPRFRVTVPTQKASRVLCDRERKIPRSCWQVSLGGSVSSRFS